ncbi:hypothetical protein FHU33_4897 [Blastococcus colisei]|uniref:Uncharacterized protein n=1 Tax=Blastococcus colisei TaxID=1564162 RepID=A0A543NV11_9ACTN|nr:hypothetical protein [Blastococcus colisei]TQN35669.1 hypothetical protein FHU33_4897 [Blastococcus colisei]
MWHVGFTDDPDPEALRRFDVPGNEIPVAQPRDELLARTDEAAGSSPPSLRSTCR